MAQQQQSSERPIHRSDIYAHWTARERRLLYIAGGLISILTPFCDTVYLPALKDIALDLRASDELAADTVSTYLAAVGCGQLIWGAMSDYFGRRRTLFLALLLFEAFTIGIIFVQDIVPLIILRTLEGLVVGSTVCIVTSQVGDVYAPEERGAAMGAMMGPLLIGPIIAPLIGGALAQAGSWRACFILLTVMAGATVAFAYFYNPETQHYYVATYHAEEIRSRQGQPVDVKIRDIWEGEGGGVDGEKADATRLPTMRLDSEMDSPPRGGGGSGAASLSPSAVRLLALKTVGGVVGSPDASDKELTANAYVPAAGSTWSADGLGLEGGGESQMGVSGVSEGGSGDIPPPELVMPWTVSRYLFDLQVMMNAALGPAPCVVQALTPSTSAAFFLFVGCSWPRTTRPWP